MAPRRPPPARRDGGGARRRWARPAASVAAVVLCAALLPGGRDQAQAAAAVLANLLACHGFAATLLPWREPLISRYTRFAHDGRPPPEFAPYTRRLTAAWAALLAGFAAAQAAALAGLWPPTAVLAAEAAAGGAFFLGEHLARPFLFPQHGPATLGRTFRAVRLAHAAEARDGAG